MFVVVFPELVANAESLLENEPYEKEDLYLRIGELQNYVYCIGSATGPFFGEYIAERRGFDFAFYVSAGILTASGILYLLICGLGSLDSPVSRGKGDFTDD